jgi:Class II Aldolase and Adducin N-terminal domain
VTNAIDYLVTELVDKEHLNPERIVIIEHYDDLPQETFELVKMERRRNGSFTNPEWKAISRTDVERPGPGARCQPLLASVAPLRPGAVSLIFQAVSRPGSPNPALFFMPEAEAIKKEICTAGKKLWMRQFVDGNGGNISFRIGPNEVICTATFVSKFDLTPDDLCLVDLEGNQVAGARPRTSEIFLHLEIYKAVPEARAAVHCRPPHATAYAFTGRLPPNLVIPEFEAFVGKVAISPYETPKLLRAPSSPT